MPGLVVELLMPQPSQLRGSIIFAGGSNLPNRGDLLRDLNSYQCHGSRFRILPCNIPHMYDKMTLVIAWAPTVHRHNTDTGFLEHCWLEKSGRTKIAFHCSAECLAVLVSGYRLPGDVGMLK